MIEVNITQAMRDEAKDVVEKLGEHKNNHRSSKDSMITGYLGEVVYQTLTDAKHSNTYNYDFIKDGKTIDVKTKRISYSPEDWYHVSIFSYNLKQKCDYYAFIYVRKDFEKAWLLGVLPKQVYLDNAYDVQKGDKCTNGMPAKQPSKDMKVADIWRLSVEQEIL
jgi:hypothetical protein